MPLYVTPDGRWAGTQADANKLSREWETVEMPTDKKGWLALLNREPADSPTVEQIEEAPVAQPTPDPAPAAEPPPLTLTEVETFVQNADRAQVSSIFENCVYRGRELMRSAA